MSEPRKPVFGFLWPRPDPHAPVDGDFRQTRPVRICTRGPMRLLALVACTVLVTMATATAVMAAAGSGLSAYTVVGGAIAASGLFVLLRGWVVGTYVTDDAVIIETTFHRRSMRWADLTALRVIEQRCPLLGTPLRVRSARVIVVDGARRSFGTHVYASSPDLWLRPEAFDIAVLRIERWSQASPR